MIYNKPETIYFKAAKKLLELGTSIINEYETRIKSINLSKNRWLDVDFPFQIYEKVVYEPGNTEEQSRLTPNNDSAENENQIKDTTMSSENNRKRKIEDDLFGSLR